jgi:ribonucleoside-diphosphate reductase alpha chain
MTQLPESVQAILEDRFLHDGEFKWAQVCARAAEAWSHTDDESEEFFEMMLERRGIPNTPALANAGREVQMASACFVLPINDSLTDGPASIMQTLMDTAAVHKSGGGTGFSGARIRGRGEMVSSTGRPAPGAVNVLELYSDAIGRVTQAGMRPGANMFILPDDHPDVMEFVKCKNGSETKITNFNISVGASDFLMNDVADGKLVGDLWGAIIDGMWENGEPGLWFRDTTNKARLHPEEFEATNPCGEVPLLEYEACVLGSINIAAHLHPDPTKHLWGFDWEALRRTIHTMVRMLDNIIDLQDYPLPEIEAGQKRYRKIGVNPMGWADALVKLGVRYGSEESLMLADNVSYFMQDETYRASKELADEKGPYSGYDVRSSLWGYPYRRNLCTMVGAPTGTVSRLGLCSMAIEPHPNVNEAGEFASFILKSRFTDRVMVDHRSPAFTPASEVTLMEHILMQAAWQKHTDQAISKTINCPESTTREELAAAVRLAWELGCKGVTVLREKSRVNVVIGDADCNGGSCVIPSEEQMDLEVTSDVWVSDLVDQYRTPPEKQLALEIA